MSLAHIADMFFQLLPNGLKGIPDGNVHIFVTVIFGRLIANDDNFSGHTQLDVHSVKRAFRVLPMGGLNHHAATGEAIRTLFNFSNFFLDTHLDGSGVRKIPKRYDYWDLHKALPAV